MADPENEFKIMNSLKEIWQKTSDWLLRITGYMCSSDKTILGFTVGLLTALLSNQKAFRPGIYLKIEADESQVLLKGLFEALQKLKGKGTTEVYYQKIILKREPSEENQRKTLLKLIEGIGGKGAISEKSVRIRNFIESLKDPKNVEAVMFLARQIWLAKAKLLKSLGFLYEVTVTNDNMKVVGYSDSQSKSPKDNMSPLLILTCSEPFEWIKEGVYVSLSLKNDEIANNDLPKKIETSVLDTGTLVPISNTLSVVHKLFGKEFRSENEMSRGLKFCENIAKTLENIELAVKSRIIELANLRAGKRMASNPATWLDETLATMKSLEKQLGLIIPDIDLSEDLSRELHSKINYLLNTLFHLKIKLREKVKEGLEFPKISENMNEIVLDNGQKCTDFDKTREEIKSNNRKLCGDYVGKLFGGQELTYEELNMRIGYYIVPYTRMVTTKAKYCLSCGENLESEPSNNEKCQHICGSCFEKRKQVIGCPKHKFPASNSSIHDNCGHYKDKSITYGFIVKEVKIAAEIGDGFGSIRCPYCDRSIDTNIIIGTCGTDVKEALEKVKAADLMQKKYYKCKEHRKPLENKLKRDKASEYGSKCNFADCPKCKLEVCRHCGELNDKCHEEAICEDLKNKILYKEKDSEHKVIKCQKCEQVNVVVGKKLFCCHCDSKIEIPNPLYLVIS